MAVLGAIGACGLLGALLGSGAARGQGLPAGPLDDAAVVDPDAGVADQGLPPLQASTPVPWSKDHRWRSTGLDTPVNSVAITPQKTWLALAPDGTVFRAMPGGAWRIALGAPGTEDVMTSADEDVLLEGEATVDELLSVSATDESTSNSSDYYDGASADSADLADAQIDLAGDVSTQVTEQVEDMDQAVLDVEDGLSEGPKRAEVGIIWVQPGPGNLALAGRADGLWRSTDDGRTWRRVSPAAGVSAVLDLGGGRLLAGGANGLGSSQDGGARWRRVGGSLSDLRVLALTKVGGVLLAGTDGGLFMSLDGQRWTAIAPDVHEDLVVYDILPDPTWTGGMWLATSQGILRSDDLGQTLRLASRNPLVGTRDMVTLGSPGQLLAAGDPGVWESIDGGLIWLPLASGLPSPNTRALAVAGSVVLVGGEDGVRLLGRAPPMVQTPVGQRGGARQQGPALYQVVGHALGRTGLDLNDVTVGNRLILAQMAPRLELRFRHQVKRYRETLYESLYTTDYRYPTSDFEARLCWGACTSLDASYDISGSSTSSSSDLQASDITELAVVNGEIYDLADSGALNSAAANVAQRATTYRLDVARLVSETWLSRKRLQGESASMATLPLAEQVTHVLLLAELTARLDVYTDGWFSQSLASSSSSVQAD
ncbi:MAG: hypothetical protein GXP62_20710 [Oligoflexia bacterium]|nr:hypothetical protein [Oligoflexia bacterium]